MRYILFPVATIFMVLVGLLAFEEPTRQTEASPVFNLYWAPDNDTISGPDTLGNDGDTLTLYPGKNLDGRFTYNYTIRVYGGDSLTTADALLNGDIFIYENNKDVNDADYESGWYELSTNNFEIDGTLLQFTADYIYGRRHKVELIATDSFGVVVYDIDATFKRE